MSASSAGSAVTLSQISFTLASLPLAAAASSKPYSIYQLSTEIENPKMRLSDALDRVEATWSTAVQANSAERELLCLMVIKKAEHIASIELPELKRILKLFFRADPYKLLEMRSNAICNIFAQEVTTESLTTHFFFKATSILQVNAKIWFKMLRTRCAFCRAVVEKQPKNVDLRETLSYYILSEFAKGFRHCTREEIQKFLDDVQPLLHGNFSAPSLDQMIVTIALAVIHYFSNSPNLCEAAKLRKNWHLHFVVRFKIHPTWTTIAQEVCREIFSFLGNQLRRLSNDWSELMVSIKDSSHIGSHRSPYNCIEDERMRAWVAYRRDRKCIQLQEEFLLRAVSIFSELLISAHNSTAVEFNTHVIGQQLNQGLLILTTGSWHSGEVATRLFQRAFPNDHLIQDVKEVHLEHLLLTFIGEISIPIDEVLNCLTWVLKTYRFSEILAKKVLVLVLKRAASSTPLSYTAFHNLLQFLLREDLVYSKQELFKESGSSIQRIFKKGFKLDDALHRRFLSSMSGKGDQLAVDLEGSLAEWTSVKAMRHSNVVVSRTGALNELFVRFSTQFKLSKPSWLQRLPLHWLRVCVQEVQRMQTFAASFDAPTSWAQKPIVDIDFPQNTRGAHLVLRHSPPLRYKVLNCKARFPFVQMKSELLCIIANCYALLTTELRVKAGKHIAKLIGVRFDAANSLELLVSNLGAEFVIGRSVKKVATAADNSDCKK